ncbi:MAG: hypothetical protein ACLRUZ_00960 [Faecalimonas sp.]
MKILSAVTTQLETISADSEAAVSQAKETAVSEVNAQIAERNICRIRAA